MKRVGFSSLSELREAILAGELGQKPDDLMISGAVSILQTTRFSRKSVRYSNRYVLLRVEDCFGACSHTAEQLSPEEAGDWSGRSLREALDDECLPIRTAAMDAYLGAVIGHARSGGEAVRIEGGAPIVKARRRDALIAELADIRPGQRVALIGVVHPLIEAIRERGGVCLPCDLQLERTQWGDAVEPDMEVVLASADNVICTGMTIGNGTFDRVLARVRERGIPLTVYAQTGSAVAAAFVGCGVTALAAEPFPFTQFSAEASTLYRYAARGGERL